jgi:hypothetical protein
MNNSVSLRKARSALHPSDSQCKCANGLLSTTEYVDLIVGKSIFQFSSAQCNRQSEGFFKTATTDLNNKCSPLTSPPKRPRTAFNYFFRAQQKQVIAIKGRNRKEAHSAGTISRHWKALMPDQKAIYFQMAAQDKFRYYREKREYEDFAYAAKTNDPAPLDLDTSTDSSSLNSCSQSLQIEKSLTVVSNDELAFDSAEHDVPPCSNEAIADLANKLDKECIDFLIKALL